MFDFLPQGDVSVDVFDFDGCVIHQDTDSERQSSQCHDVDRLPDRAQHDDGGEDRQRNRGRDDERASPAAEKDENHQARKAGSNTRFFHHTLNGAFHENGLVGERLNFQGRRHRLLDLRQERLNPGDDAKSRGIAIFLHGQESGALTVHADNVGLRRVAIAHPGDIADVSGGGPDSLDRDAIQLIDRLGSRIRNINFVFLGTDL